MCWLAGRVGNVRTVETPEGKAVRSTQMSSG